MTKDTGGAAFPTKPGEETIGGEVIRYEGMTLRDWFAGQALMGCAQMLPSTAGNHREEAARVAYELADAMLAERNK